MLLPTAVIELPDPLAPALGRNAEANLFGSSEIDDELELFRLLDGHRSPGFAPFRILSTLTAARLHKSVRLEP
jgi:hypothetical protein